MASYTDIGGNKKLIGDQGGNKYVNHGGMVIDMGDSKKGTGTVTPPSTKKPSTGSTTPTTPSTPSVGGGVDYASMINDLLGQQRAAAEAAYGNAKARLEDAWGSTIGSLDENRNIAMEQLRKNYDYSSGQARDDANKSLREAYVNYMMNKKNMNQNLSALGISGGASESTRANMYNSYGNSRNNINTTLNDNLASLLNAYQNNVASVNQAYNSQYADAVNNYMAQLNALETALANNAISNYSGGNLSNLASYATTLGNIMADMQNTQIAPNTNTLAVNTVSTNQGISNDPGSVTNYAKYKALLDDLTTSGTSDENKIRQLTQAGATLDDLKALYGYM